MSGVPLYPCTWVPRCILYRGTSLIRNTKLGIDEPAPYLAPGDVARLGHFEKARLVLKRLALILKRLALFFRYIKKRTKTHALFLKYVVKFTKNAHQPF